MFTRSLATLAALLAPAGCYRRPAEPATAPVAAVPAAPAIEEVGWPTRLEFRLDEQEDVLQRGGLAMFTVETRLPVFQSEPPGVAAAINARLRKLGKPDLDPRTYEGKYTIECSVELANRYAVMFDCSRSLEEQRQEEDEEDEGDGWSEPSRLAFGWWLRRGLPSLSLEQFAPYFDLQAAIEAEVPSQPPGCDLRSCAFSPKSFLIDSEGITLVATEDCPPLCDASVPTVPLDRLAPAHAWAEELVKRVRRRVDAGDGLAEGDRTY
jgi:hypothetical protein